MTTIDVRTPKEFESDQKAYFKDGWNDLTIITPTTSSFCSCGFKLHNYEFE